MDSQASHVDTNSPARANSVVIRPAATEDELHQVFRLRYEVYIKEQGKPIPAADHAQGILREPIDDFAFQLVAFVSNCAVAAVRRSYSDGCILPDEIEHLFSLQILRQYRNGLIGHSTRFVIKNEFRHSRIAIQLTAEAYRLSLLKPIQFDVLLSHPGLVPLYESLAYRRIGKTFFDPISGIMFPMVLLLRDLDYLETIRSPWLRVSRSFDHDAEIRTWFFERFPETINQKRHEREHCPANLVWSGLEKLWALGFEHIHGNGECLQKANVLSNAVAVVLCGRVQGTGVIEVGKVQCFGSHSNFEPSPAKMDVSVAEGATRILWIPTERLVRFRETEGNIVKLLRETNVMPSSTNTTLKQI